MCLPPARSLKMEREEQQLFKLVKTGEYIRHLIYGMHLSKGSLTQRATTLPLIQNVGFESTTSQKRAREIMDKNFFGLHCKILICGSNLPLNSWQK
jgi:hypothetical protein